jgi:hypothetical protein
VQVTVCVAVVGNVQVAEPETGVPIGPVRVAEGVHVGVCGVPVAVQLPVAGFTVSVALFESTNPAVLVTRTL